VRREGLTRDLTPWLLLAAFLLSASLISLAGFYYYRWEQARNEQLVGAKLAGLARLKAETIENWRQERLSDGSVVARTAPLGDAFAAALAQDDPARGGLGEWANAFSEHYGYDGALFFDAAGEPRFSIGLDPGEIDRFSKALAARAVREQRVFMTDIHRHERGGGEHLGLVTFLRDSAGTAVAGAIFVIDPARYLIPALQRWDSIWGSTGVELYYPHTARADAGSAARQFKRLGAPGVDATALCTRMRSADPGAYVHITSPGTGTTRLASMAEVNNTAWCIIASVDHAEVTAPVRRTALLAGGAVTGLVGASGALFALAWWRRRNADLARQLELERERGELADTLRRNEAQMRAYFEGAVIGMAITSLEKGWLRVNRALTDMLGYAEDELRSLTWAELTHPDDLEQDVRQFERLVKGEITGYQLEKRFLRKDGTALPALLGVSAARRDDGNAEFFIAQIIDLSAEKAAQAELEKQRAALPALFSGIDSVIYVADPESYELLHVNDAFRSNWGGGEEVIGRQCYEVLQGRDSPCPFCTNDKIFGEHLGRTYRWEFQNEITQRWYGIADKAIPWVDGRYVRFEIASDITEQKAANDERLRSEKFSALGRLTAGVAHELNNPLMGIINFAQYLKSETEPGDERFEVMGDIERETRRCMDIVTNLLAFSRTSPTSAAPREPVDVAQIVKQVLKLLEYRLRKMDITVDLQPGDDLPPVMLRRDAWQQVYLNLVTNAIDALEGRETRRLTTRLRIEGDSLVLEVEDTGTGMDAQTRERMFDPFYSTKPQGRGTGLGLSTCVSLVRDDNGDIQCTSRDGIGTTMTVRWLGCVEVEHE
jgi:PAS domain S-box-containing protein